MRTCGFTTKRTKDTKEGILDRPLRPKLHSVALGADGGSMIVALLKWNDRLLFVDTGSVRDRRTWVSLNGGWRMAEEKVIAIESRGGPLHTMLSNVMRMVPQKDQHDVALQRMLAFRLGVDGESATREYLMRKIRDMIQCRYNGRLYDFLCNPQYRAGHMPANRGTEPPERA